MRTTIRLSDELMREAKREAAKSGMTLTAIIEESLRERLARSLASAEPRSYTRLATSGGRGPCVQVSTWMIRLRCSM